MAADRARDPQALERIYRDELVRLRASLAAKIGDVSLAEELVHDAFVEAIEHWRADGVPANPAGWLATTAQRKAIDRLRRTEVGEAKLRLLVAADRDMPESDADDELLGLIFACCHPSLARESQVALTLRTVCGLTTAEIASAFIVGESTMAQRLSRARNAVRSAGVPVRVPDPDDWGQRLDEVLAVVYLVYNEGYLASASRQPARRDLAAQAVALARTLHGLMPREPEVHGLLALLLLHESRAQARFDGWGRLVRLEDQDRARWDHGLVDEARTILERGLAMRRPGQYQIQAAIAAVHAEAPSYAETDWFQIRVLYDQLDGLLASPIVKLNRAVATRYVIGPSEALAEVENLERQLHGYRLFHAVRGELLDTLGRSDDARVAYERALELVTNPAERDLLIRRSSGRPA